MNKPTTVILAALLLAPLAASHAAEVTPTQELDRETLDQWSAPYRGWHYQPGHVIPATPNIPGHADFKNPDVPCVYQFPGQPDKWFMSFIAFNGKGYNSFVAESTDLLKWTNPRLAMGFGPANEFDAGGCVIGAFLYESYDIKAPRILKQREGKFWTLYGCYPRQGGYELRPGYEGAACSDDGLTWKRAKNTPILAVQDSDCAAWEKDCIYQPWLVEERGRYYNFYNAAKGGTEQTGLAFSTDLLNWSRHPENPIIRNRPEGYDAQFASDPKVFRDGDHWTMLYFGVGKGGAHIMAAFSRDLVHWTAHPEPLYQAGGNPSGLDQQYAHKISLVYNPKNETFYLYYCACGNQGRGIGLITSKPLPAGGPAPTPTPAVKDGSMKAYTLAWADEFNGTALDASKWNYRTDSRHWSTQKPGNVEVAGGHLKLHVRKEEAGGMHYTGSGVISKAAFRYGYYEARMKVPPGAGWHTSFWMMRHAGTGGAGQELDVIENDSIHKNSYGVNIHKWKGERVSFGGKTVKTPDLSADFHVFGCEFTATTVKYFCDGELVQSVDVTKAKKKDGTLVDFEHGDQNVWLTTIASHLGGTKAVDDTRLPALAEFDYVRFFSPAKVDKPVSPPGAKSSVERVTVK